MKNTNKIKCGKAHSGSKQLVRTIRGFCECLGCGQTYNDAQVGEAKRGDGAGRGLLYIQA